MSLMAHDDQDYEAIRLSNIARNKALLESLGLGEYKIPDAPVKASKASASKKKKTSAPGTKKRKVSEDTAVDTEEGAEKRARTPKRPKLDTQDSEDTLVGIRRSSRSVRRISYANDGAHVAAARARALGDDSGSGSDFDSDADDDDNDDVDELDEGGVGKSKKRGKKAKNGKNGRRRLVHGLVDETKQRNVAKMGERSHDP